MLLLFGSSWELLNCPKVTNFRNAQEDHRQVPGEPSMSGVLVSKDTAMFV